MDRRKFLKTLFITGAAAYLTPKKLSAMFTDSQPVHPDTRQVIIIGSGYGASVAALRLTEAGIPCTILEMGQDWNKPGLKFSPMINPGKSAAWLKKKTVAPFLNVFSLKPYAGTLDRVDFDNIKIYLGRGVGGGSLVNGGMAVKPKEDYFKEIFPQLDSHQFYNKYFPLAERELHVNHISEEFYQNSKYYQFARLGEKEAKKAGFKTQHIPNVYNFKYMEEEEKGNVPKSALAGEVIYGNNHGKVSLDKSYLKKALRTGLLNIMEFHHVQSIENTKDGYELEINVLNELGEVVDQKTMFASHLFLGAGSIGSTELLLKSIVESKLKIKNKTIGQEWGNNGNVMAGRNFVSGNTGVNQSTIPIMAIDGWDEPEHPFFAEISPFPLNMEVWTALYLVINKVPKLGSLSYEKDGLKLHWGNEHTKQMKKNTKQFIKSMSKANIGTPAHMLFKKGVADDICYHPLGGLTLGNSTNEYGKLKGAENLYVIDGALVPGTVGVNPFLTITAIAEYCMENIIEKDFKEV